MRQTAVPVLTVLVVAFLSACQAKKPETVPAPQAKVMSEEDKTLYALGALIGKNLELFQLTPKELDVVKLGLTDGVTRQTPQVDADAYREQVDKLHTARMAAVAQKEAEAGTAFLAKATAEKGATENREWLGHL